jgi:predicted ester cyclase
MSVEQNKQIMRRYYEALNTQGGKAAWETLRKYIAPDYVRHSLNAPDLRLDTADFAKMMDSFFNDTTDWQAKIEDVFGEGDKLTIRETYRYRQLSTGKVMKGSAIMIFHFDQDKIIEVWEHGGESAEIS